jgi:hypothetical protein
LKEEDEMKKLFPFRSIALVSLLFSLLGGVKASAPESIERGLWAVWLGDPFPGYLSQAEKQKMLDIGTNYVVACIPNDSVYMHFCDSTGGAITMNIEGPRNRTGLPDPYGKLWTYIRLTPHPDTSIITEYIRRIYTEYGNPAFGGGSVCLKYARRVSLLLLKISSGVKA